MEILWTNRARNNFFRILSFLESEWTEKEVERFIQITEKHITLISSGTFLGRPAYKRKNVYSLLLDKNNRLYYKIQSNKIYILEFWDTRKNPAKNPFD